MAYADHPYFHNRNFRHSLIRGFEQFNVITNLLQFTSYTNIGTKNGAIERVRRLQGMEDMSPAQLRRRVRQFNDGTLRFNLQTEADFDPINKLYFAKLYDMFRDSEYFQKRYGKEFDRYVFSKDQGQPYFLFLNLHMCTIARPDPGLWTHWLLKTVMLNAQAKNAKLVCDPQETDVHACLRRNLERLGLRMTAAAGQGFPPEADGFKHVFDNRFYDANFRAVVTYLTERGAMRNTVTIVLSDHGMAYSEHGEEFYLHGGARPHEYIVRVPLIIRFPENSELRR